MDRDTIIQTCATLFVVAVIVFGLALSLRIWQNRPRRRRYIIDTARPVTSEQEHDLYTTLQALERVIATLEQDEAYQREAQLGNDVVRLDECRAVLEAEQVAEQYQARLERQQEG